MVIVPDRVAERVLTRVVMGPLGCHVSEYSVGSHGYSQVGWHGNGQRIVTTGHAVAWVGTYGPDSIPPGFTLDHVVCGRRRCVNVAHMRLLTRPQNCARTRGRDWPLNECANGHELAEHWYRPPNAEKGHCRACVGDRQRAYRARRKAQLAPSG